MKIIILLIFSLAILVSCSSTKLRRDDAIRIKKEAVNKYNMQPQTGIYRNGSALRGEILKIQVEIKPDSCPINPDTKYTQNSYILFIDSNVKNKSLIEKIPIEDVDLIGTKLKIPSNQYNNINYFETYNNPLLPLEIREVPIDTIVEDCNSTHCPCEDISINIPCLTCLECPQRELGNLFLSLKAGFAFYDDKDKLGRLYGRDDNLIDVAAGYRWGESKRYVLGLIYSTGVQTLNLIDTTLLRRPSLNLYARYDLWRNIRKDESKLLVATNDANTMITYDTIHTKTQDGCCDDSTIVIARFTPDCLQKLKEIQNITEYEERPCLNPFIYGLLGVSLDNFTLDVLKMNFNSDCSDNISQIHYNMPLNYGFGVGIEYPLSRYIDLSADLGFRSIAYGDKSIVSGYIAPINQRVNSIVFRIGIVY